MSSTWALLYFICRVESPYQRVRWALWCGARGAVKERGGLCPEYFCPPSSQVRRPARGRGQGNTGSQFDWPNRCQIVAKYVSVARLTCRPTTSTKRRPIRSSPKTGSCHVKILTCKPSGSGESWQQAFQEPVLV